VTAKVFADAYESWGRLRGEPRLWLFGIARRRVADSLRRRRWWALKETDASTDGMSEFMHSEEVRMAVSITMRLPEAERDAFLLQALEGFSIAEIATIIGRSPKATNSLLQRAKARIRRMVDREERFK
jgi:RNA polymerase sigma-70 factor (ECF subfamily)